MSQACTQRKAQGAPWRASLVGRQRASLLCSFAGLCVLAVVVLPLLDGRHNVMRHSWGSGSSSGSQQHRAPDVIVTTSLAGIDADSSSLHFKITVAQSSDRATDAEWQQVLVTCNGATRALDLGSGTSVQLAAVVPLTAGAQAAAGPAAAAASHLDYPWDEHRAQVLLSLQFADCGPSGDAAAPSAIPLGGRNSTFNSSGATHPAREAGTPGCITAAPSVRWVTSHVFEAGPQPLQVRRYTQDVAHPASGGVGGQQQQQRTVLDLQVLLTRPTYVRVAELVRPALTWVVTAYLASATLSRVLSTVVLGVVSQHMHHAPLSFLSPF